MKEKKKNISRWRILSRLFFGGICAFVFGRWSTMFGIRFFRFLSNFPIINDRLGFITRINDRKRKKNEFYHNRAEKFDLHNVMKKKVGGGGNGR